MKQHRPNTFVYRILRLILTLVYLFLCGDVAKAQGIFGPVGAKAWSMGGSSAAQSDVWSATNNTGAAAFVTKIQGGLYNEQRFRERSLNLSNLSVVLPTKLVNIGASINYYGFEAFNQQKVGLSLSKAVHPMLGFGIQMSYVATNIGDNNGRADNFVLEGGVWAKPVKNMKAGVAIANPNQARYSNALRERIPSYARLGIAYQLSSAVQVTAEADQGSERPLVLRGGLSYRIHPVLTLAIGAANNPFYYTFGTSVHLKYFRLDLAASLHEVLGVTPHLGISLPVSEDESR